MEMSESEVSYRLLYTSFETFIFLHFKNYFLSFTLFLIYEICGNNFDKLKNDTIDFKLHYFFCICSFICYFIYYNDPLYYDIGQCLLMMKTSNPFLYLAKHKYTHIYFNISSKILFYVVFFIFRIYYPIVVFGHLIVMNGYRPIIVICMPFHILNIYWFYKLTIKLWNKLIPMIVLKF